MLRSALVDKALLQALIYSLLLHLILFGTFRIRLNDYKETATEMRPLSVAIDVPDEFGVAVEKAAPYDTSSLVTSTFDEDEYKAMHLSMQHPVKLEPTYHPPEASNTLSAYTDKDIIDLAGNFTYAPKAYPLQLKLSSQLKALTLVEDGSSLFRKKAPHEDLSHLALAANHFPIEYTVTVSGPTGTITTLKRPNVLLDKELQLVADRIIKCIRFEPFSQKSVTGTITLVFCTSGQELKSYLSHD